MKKAVLWAALWLAAVVPGFSKANEQINDILNQKQIKAESAAYLLLTAKGYVPDATAPDVALADLRRRGWTTLQTGDAVSIETLSWLLVKTFEVSGGLLSAVFPSPRYAYRDLAFYGLINDSRGPGRLISGEELLRTLQKVMDFKTAKSEAAQ